MRKWWRRTLQLAAWGAAVGAIWLANTAGARILESDLTPAAFVQWDTLRWILFAAIVGAIGLAARRLHQRLESELARSDFVATIRNAPLLSSVYIERTRETDAIDARLSARRSHVLALTGPEGVGKSTLIARYLATEGTRFRPAWWIDASSAEGVVRGLGDLARSLDLSLPGEGPRELAERALTWLSRDSGWLVVLDGLAEVSHIELILVRTTDVVDGHRSASGRIVITTQSDSVWPELRIDTLRIDPLDRTDAAQLLFMSMGSPHDWHQTAAEKLVAELGYNPGRIVDVGARVLANKMSVEAYAKTLTDDPERLVDPHGLPSQIALAELLNPDATDTPEKILGRWRANSSMRTSGDLKSDTPRTKGLRTVVGQSEFGPLSLDLRSDGLNALVGATTGGGKSEFLQTWVLGLALEYGPDRVTFLFVDYQAGWAFADCVRLPHCVGLITDLSHRLAQRALTSLRVELHRREHLLNRKKAKDLLELEKRGDPEAPPALVIVVDEFAALAAELPEFVDGLVDIAQRGRPLGIHLIMGTQRPTGVVSKSLSAIAGLRVALRTADGADSRVFLGSELAAEIDSQKTGRAYVKKSTSGEILAFQAAYSSGWSMTPPTDDDVDLGPNDQQQLVERIQEAFTAGGLPLPRRPWLDSLADVYDLTKLHQRTDSELLIGVADVPEQQAQQPIYFDPDQDGHLGIYGSSGSGKSTALRTLATAAGITPQGGPVHVYGLDFAAGALRMLESLPHVGTIAQGKDHERIVGLMRMLRDKLRERREEFEAANATSLTEYRSITGRTDVPRVVVVLDGLPKFREEYDMSVGRMEWFTALHDIFDDGRGVGMHIIFTADRYGAVPSYVRSMVQRNILLRMPDDGFVMFDAPRDIVTQASPSGRAVVDALEVQVAVVGGTTSVQEQTKATERLAESMRRAGIGSAPAVQVLPKEYPAALLPDFVGAERWPVLGLDDLRVAPLGFEPTGTLVVAGPPGSGRSNACVAICRAVHRANPEARLYLFAQARSAIAGELPWADAATDANGAAALAEDLLHAVQDEDTSPGIVVVIEGLDDYLRTPAEKPIQDLTKAIRKSDHLLVAEAETSAWSSTWPLLSEVKNGRRGLILQPENIDVDLILNTTLPRAARSEFPAGRGVWVARGKSLRVQVPLVLGAGTG